jgi:hypothetical protein
LSTAALVHARCATRAAAPAIRKKRFICGR